MKSYFLVSAIFLASVAVAGELPVAEFTYSERAGVRSVALTPDGRELAATTRTAPEGLVAWKVTDGRKGRVPDVRGVAARVAYGNAGPRMAVALPADSVDGRDGRIALFDLSGGPGPVLRGAEDVRSIAFSPDDDVVVAATAGGVVAWDLREGSSSDLLRVRGGADSVSFGNAEELYVVSEQGAMIHRLSLPSGDVLEQWKGKANDGPVAMAPGGGVLATGTADGTLKLFDLDRGGKPSTVDLGVPVTALGWAADGKVLAVGLDDGRVEIHPASAAGLPRGFAETPRLRGRGGAVDGSWDGDTREAVSFDDRRRDERRGDAREPRKEKADDDRADTNFGREDDGGDFRLDLGRPREDARGGGGPGPVSRKSGTAKSGPVDVVVTPTVVVLDSVGDDPREPADLERSLKKNAKRLKKCWKQAQRAGENSIGRIVFEMAITAEGEGRRVGEPVRDEIGSEKLSACFQERLREGLFGAGLGSIDVRLELVLSPE